MKGDRERHPSESRLFGAWGNVDFNRFEVRTNDTRLSPIYRSIYIFYYAKLYGLHLNRIMQTKERLRTSI